MAFTLPELPYAKDALAPHISAQTLEFHHGKHHAGYVNKLNAAIEGTDLAGKSLEDIIKATAGNPEKSGVFNNAAQVWNHSFYWQCMKPGGGGQPSGSLAEKSTPNLAASTNWLPNSKPLVAVSSGAVGLGWYKMATA